MQKMLFKDADFDMIINGRRTGLYHLRNKNGVVASFSNYGARIVRLAVPNEQGGLTELVAGYQSISQYLRSTEPYHGATVGRYCNRVNRAQFELNGQKYHLRANDGIHALHGGPQGFHNAIWDVAGYKDGVISFSYLSQAFEEGYPGNLMVHVSYRLDDLNKLTISYNATTDNTTVINLTNHAYFNLNGIGSGSAMDHGLIINADTYLPVDEMFIPTGTVMPLEGGAFDFRDKTIIGDTLRKFKLPGGYNHNFILNPHDFEQPVAQLFGDQSNIRLDVFTDQPGIQLYTGDHFSGENVLAGGFLDHYQNLIALETQYFPDSVNQPSFPSTVLQPGEEFVSTTVYGFQW